MEGAKRLNIEFNHKKQLRGMQTLDSTPQVKANSVLFDLTLKRYLYVNFLQVGVPEIKKLNYKIKK